MIMVTRPHPYREAEKSEAEKEMDIIRNRIRDLEEASGLARAWKRVTIGLVALGIIACGTTYTVVEAKAKRAKDPCKDMVIDFQVQDNIMSCPHVDHKLTVITPKRIDCLCR